MTIECKNCSMHEQCICEASADECEIRKQSYNKALDDFVHKVKEHQYVLSDVINSKDYGMFTIGIEQIAEQLKAGVED